MNGPEAPAPPRRHLDVSRLRRAQRVHGVMLEVILALLVVLGGALAGLATANVAARDVVHGLADPTVLRGPLENDQYRALHALQGYYQGGASTTHALVLGLLASICLVMAYTVRRRLLPEGVSRRHLLLTLAVVAGTVVLANVAASPLSEVGRRVDADRALLLPESLVWSNAVEFSFVLHVAITMATLALAFALLTPIRRLVVVFGVLAGAGYALLLLAKLPFGPLARPETCPAAFLDLPGRAVRLGVWGERAGVVRAVLPDVGLAFDPPPLDAAAEQAAAAAAERFGLDDCRGAAAAHLHALAPLARFDAGTAALRIADLWRRTGSPRLLTVLGDLLRTPAPFGPGVEPALAAFADLHRVRAADRSVAICRTLVLRGQVDDAARLKDQARADGTSEAELAACVVAPPAVAAAVSGSIRAADRPAAGVGVGLLDERAAEEVGALEGDSAWDLTRAAGIPMTRTGPDGRYRFDRLRPGRYRLVVLLADPHHEPDRSAGSGPPPWIDAAPGAEVEVPAVRLVAP